MTWVSDDAIARLRVLEDRPDFSATRYEIGEEIGRGGMGIVFRGRDRELDRDVAIKVTTLSTAADAERLRAEARTLARLEHPGIVAVHDVGRLPDGRVFTVMMLARGERLDARAATLSLTDRLRLFDRICDTVAFAHAHGIIHGDLTPANIIAGAHGQVLVLDWGLARAESDSGQRAGVPAQHTQRSLPDTHSGPLPDTRSGLCPRREGIHACGTDGYMAPEASTQNVDARADVYALGAILRDFLPSPSTRFLRPLESVVRRARESDPGKRYATAADLTADVRRFTDGAAVTAHPESVGERAVRLARTYRTPIALVLAYLAMRGLLLFWSG
ncbi:MAG TPA: serine/threonine-protein kinase [Vicinamibacterales bacterium]|nr:serine/threonine-protein kinase [Vicinamibacterales bacterium]